MEDIKGTLEGTVTVQQPGGYVEEEDAVAVFENSPLLEPGQEVLLSTKHDSETGRYGIVAPGYGDERIQDDKDRKDKVEKFKEANASQVDPKVLDEP